MLAQAGRHRWFAEFGRIYRGYAFCAAIMHSSSPLTASVDRPVERKQVHDFDITVLGREYLGYSDDPNLLRLVKYGEANEV
jgi:hypothetical protein